MGDGFGVDVGALRAAGEGINDLVKQMDEHAVEDIDCAEDAVGHGGLADTLETFCERWQRGVENLLEDGAEAAKRLIATADQYERTDRAIAVGLGGDGG